MAPFYLNENQRATMLPHSHSHSHTARCQVANTFTHINSMRYEGFSVKAQGHFGLVSEGAGVQTSKAEITSWPLYTLIAIFTEITPINVSNLVQILMDVALLYLYHTPLPHPFMSLYSFCYSPYLRDLHRCVSFPSNSSASSFMEADSASLSRTKEDRRIWVKSPTVHS